jgi:hypothetical protein
MDDKNLKKYEKLEKREIVWAIKWTGSNEEAIFEFARSAGMEIFEHKILEDKSLFLRERSCKVITVLFQQYLAVNSKGVFTANDLLFSLTKPLLEHEASVYPDYD